jgi:hypothetical protein
MSKCAECGAGKATILIKWESIGENEIYCKECAGNA